MLNEVTVLSSLYGHYDGLVRSITASSYQRARGRGDLFLLAGTIGLLVIAWIMVYSSSAIIAWKNYHDPYFYLKRHSCHIVIALMAMGIAMRFDYLFIRRLTYPLLAISLILLLMVLVSPWGKEIGGARRWLALNPVSFQPSELAKLSLVIYLAHSLTKRIDRLKEFTYGYLPNFIIISLFSTLILLQPDLGTTIAISVVCCLLCFIAGTRLSHLGYSAMLCLPIVIFAIFTTGFRRQRLLAFLDPGSDPLNSGYQITQSFLALGSGGLWGLGLGQGRQKLFYLPEPHTDFVLSIIGEELGFIGVLGIIFLLGLLIWRGFRIAFRHQDLYGQLLSIGIVLSIVIQSSINLGVVVGLLPIKGLPFPFISLGGTSLLVNMVSVGILWNISRQG